MKYTELERMLLKAGCHDTGKVRNGHPLWINPKTGKVFMLSHHRSQEVKRGTLNSIFEGRGAQIAPPLAIYER